MSTLKVNNIQTASGGSNSTPTEIKSGRAKAWANLSGDSNPPTLRNSFNISSVTDHGNGDYTFNFSEAMFNTAYVCIPSAGNGNDCAFAVAQDSAQATGSIRCVYRTSRTSNATDFPLTMMVVFST